jgi:PadR family transcriptional regulator, regulatory protein PadR
MTYNVNDMSPAPASLGEFEQLIMVALLRLGPDAYGAAVCREIEMRTGRDVSFSAAYITLERLEAKGLVRSRVGDPTPQRGGRRRKHFTLQPSGRRALAHAYRTFKKMTAGLEPILENL